MYWKNIDNKFLYPPIWIIILFTVVSSITLSLVFIKELEESIVAYVVYVFSFYTLSVVCIFYSMVLPKRYREIKQKIYDNKYGNLYMTDMAFRTHISLYTSLSINLMYVGINIFSFFLYHSSWFMILAGYYIVLAVMRFLLLRYIRSNEIGKSRIRELKCSILCAAILLTVNFALSEAVLMILYQNKGFEYQGVLIYVMAMYTFYMTTHAILDLIKYRKYKMPIMTTTKVIELSAALVSMLSLETAMLSQFGADMSPENKWIMIVLTGAGVSIIIITMSLYIIIQSSKEIKKLNSN